MGGLNQTAVYWPMAGDASAGEDFDDYGQPVVGVAVEIDCRWEDVSEEFIDVTGTRQLSRAKVYVDRDVNVGGILMLGTLSDIVNADEPKTNEGAWEIRRFDKIPSFKGTKFVRTVYL